MQARVDPCWRGNPPSAPLGPLTIRFELGLDAHGAVRDLQMHGLPAEALTFRRCMNVRGREYRFTPAPDENPVRFTLVLTP